MKMKNYLVWIIEKESPRWNEETSEWRFASFLKLRKRFRNPQAFLGLFVITIQPWCPLTLNWWCQAVFWPSQADTKPTMNGKLSAKDYMIKNHLIKFWKLEIAQKCEKKNANIKFRIIVGRCDAPPHETQTKRCGSASCFRGTYLVFWAPSPDTNIVFPIFAIKTQFHHQLWVFFHQIFHESNLRFNFLMINFLFVEFLLFSVSYTQTNLSFQRR